MHQSLGMLRSAATQSGIRDNDANHLSRADPGNEVGVIGMIQWRLIEMGAAPTSSTMER